MNKRGYFFTLDAFLASGVVVVALLILFSQQSEPEFFEQSEFFASDISSLLASTKIYEINNEFVDILVANGSITGMDNTLLEQAVIFNKSGKINTTRLFLRNVTQGLVQGKYDFKVVIDGYTIYRTNYTQFNETKARTLTTSKKLVFGIYNKTHMWGPHTADLTVWK